MTIFNLNQQLGYARSPQPAAGRGAGPGNTGPSRPGERSERLWTHAHNRRRAVQVFSSNSYTNPYTHEWPEHPEIMHLHAAVLFGNPGYSH